MFVFDVCTNALFWVFVCAALIVASIFLDNERG